MTLPDTMQLSELKQHLCGECGRFVGYEAINGVTDYVIGVCTTLTCSRNGIRLRVPITHINCKVTI